MGTTRNDIRNWLSQRQNKDITHMLVVCDTFDWTDYPVYVSRNENVSEVYDDYHGPNMQKVMEVYSYNRDIEEQLKEFRAKHFD